MFRNIDANGFQAFQVKLLRALGRRLDQHLELVIMLHTIRVFAIATVGRTAARLHVSSAPYIGPQCTKRCCRMERACAHLVIVRLQHYAALLGPETLQVHNDVLECRGKIFLRILPVRFFDCHNSPFISSFYPIGEATGLFPIVKTLHNRSAKNATRRARRTSAQTLATTNGTNVTEYRNAPQRATRYSKSPMLFSGQYVKNARPETLLTGTAPK